MTVAIDTSPISNEHKYRGTGVYVTCLIEALQKYKSDISYSFFTRGNNLPNNVDLVHYPYFDPFSLTLPLVKQKTTLVTIHDLIPIAFPQYFPRGIRGEAKWILQKISLNGCSHIITDSNSSKEMIERHVGFPESNISVIYLAPRDIFLSTVTESSISAVRKRYKLPADFVLYVGDVNWNKNIPGLLEAFKLVKEKRNNIHLLLVGKTFLNDTITEVRQVNALIAELGLTTSVVKSGYMPDNDLHVLYSTARGYIQPSFAEGFGFPVIEAMASGCPCVVTKNSSLSEIAGPSFLVDADKVQSIASGILDLFGAAAAPLRTKGKEWVKQFTWRRVAEQTSDIYKKAAGI